MAKIQELRIGPTEDERGKQLAFSEIVQKLNEIIRRLNELLPD